MEINFKAIIRKPLWDARSRKCKRVLQKSYKDQERFSLQWRNDLVSKYCSKMLNGFNVKVKTVGIENLGKFGPALLIGNHQDLSDAFIIMKALQKVTHEKEENNKITTFIAKEALKYDNIIRYPLELIDVFFLERDNLRKSLEIYKNFSKFIKNNKTYGVVFPEGTRNKEGSISEFKAGAFKIAQKELIPIIPFTINNSVRGIDWKRKTHLNVEIIFHKKIQPSSFINQSTQALSERVQKIVESSFVPPTLKSNIESDSSKAKFIKKEQKYFKKQNSIMAKEEKQRIKIEIQELKIKNQEEIETQKFIDSENKKKQKKQKNKE